MDTNADDVYEISRNAFVTHVHVYSTGLQLSIISNSFYSPERRTKDGVLGSDTLKMISIVFAMLHINNDKHSRMPEIRRRTICWDYRGRWGHGSHLSSCFSVRVIAGELLVHWERLVRKEKFDLSFPFPSCPVTCS
jgi:hypothetical protein